MGCCHSGGLLEDEECSSVHPSNNPIRGKDVINLTKYRQTNNGSDGSRTTKDGLLNTPLLTGSCMLSDADSLWLQRSLSEPKGNTCSRASSNLSNSCAKLGSSFRDRKPLGLGEIDPKFVRLNTKSPRHKSKTVCKPAEKPDKGHSRGRALSL